MKTDLNTSKHFTLQMLADGIYAAISMDEGAAICNTGLIDLGGLVVIYDTFQTPQAARDLAEISRNLFGQTPLVVVNSHWHNDHYWGNQVFAGQSQILSSDKTRQIIVETGPKEVEWFQKNANRKLVEYQQQYDAAAPEQKSDALLMLAMYRGIAEAMPEFSFYPPNITFKQHLMLHGNRRTVELIDYQNGHSASDTILYIPNDGIMFLSDLLFVGCHPYLGDGHPQGQQDALRAVGQMDAEVFIPGHGPVGARQDLLMMIDYISHCCETVNNLIQQGKGKAEMECLEVDPAFRDWKFCFFFQDNLQFLWDIQNQPESRLDE